MWITQFLIGLLTASAYADRSDGIYPINIAVIVGQPIWFMCGTTSEEGSIRPIWKVKKIGKHDEEPISNGLYITNTYDAAKFMIVQSTTQNSLLTKDRAELDDAGTYKCIRTSSKESVIGFGTAQLIVFGSKPECQANAAVAQEGDYLHISCSIFYSGSLNPVIECSGMDGIDSKSLTNFSGSGNLTVFNRCVSPSDNGRNLSCAIYFERLTPIDYRTDAQKADNAPEFTHEWNHQLNVEFRPKSIVIDPRKDAYTNGELIRCIADGNPIPLYTWREIGSNDAASFNSTLVVNEKAMKGRTYECTATNTRGSLSTSITIRVSESNSNQDSSLIRGVTIVAGVICAVLFVIVIAIAIKRIAESCKSSAAAGGEIATGPDIVQHAEESESMEQPCNGYAQAEEFDIERPCIRYAGNGIPPEARKEGDNVHCNQRPALNGFPVYDEINNSQGPTSARKDVKLPVYGKVNKFSKDADQAPQEEPPVYGKVQKKKDEQTHYSGKAISMSELEKNETQETLESESCCNLSLKKVIIGADGTEYMDLSEARCLMQSESAASSAQHPLFNRSQYAEIDHTKSTSK